MCPLRYLQSEWEVRRGSSREFGPDQMKSSHCQVPLQDNSSDCGLYLLQYVESFLEVKDSVFSKVLYLKVLPFKVKAHSERSLVPVPSALRTPSYTLTSLFTYSDGSLGRRCDGNETKSEIWYLNFTGSRIWIIDRHTGAARLLRASHSCSRYYKSLLILSDGHFSVI